MNSRTALGLAFVTLAAAAQPARACRVYGAAGIPGGVADIRMTTGAAQPCLIRQTSTRSDAIGNRRYPNTQLVVTQRPSQGTATITGSRIVYTSRPGATGADAFAYRSRHKSGTLYNFRVNVALY